jgi:hypothetical protein
MEKLIHLLWRAGDHDEAAHAQALVAETAPALLASAAGVQQLEVLTGDTSAAIPAPPLLLGLGPKLASVVACWVDCIDDRGPLVAALTDVAGTTAQVDQYLVTESVPQHRAGPRAWPDGTATPGITHFSWFPQPDRLDDDAFFHGWHEVHTPKTPALHPRRVEYVRDTVARVLTPGSPPVRALVAERFPTDEDYADPARLYGSQAAIEESVVDLPLFADFETLSCRPLRQTIIKSSY